MMQPTAYLAVCQLHSIPATLSLLTNCTQKQCYKNFEVSLSFEQQLSLTSVPAILLQSHITCEQHATWFPCHFTPVKPQSLALVVLQFYWQTLHFGTQMKKYNDIHCVRRKCLGIFKATPSSHPPHASHSQLAAAAQHTLECDRHLAHDATSQQSLLTTNTHHLQCVPTSMVQTTHIATMKIFIPFEPASLSKPPPTSLAAGPKLSLCGGVRQGREVGGELYSAWHHWTNSLVHAIPNNSGQLQIVTCTSKEHVRRCECSSLQIRIFYV